jgi:uncharacterized protein (TIGR02996 family)
MTDDSALLAAIRAAPADDAPRLVYADWLDEHGHPERAEFIRVQCELARRDDPALLRREAELLAAHHDAFAGPHLAPSFRFRFGRGFILGFGHTGVFSTVPGQTIAAEQRHSTVPLTQFLRFFPDNTVLTTTSTGKPKEICRWFRRGNSASESGRYSLDAFGFPANISFDCMSDKERVEYRGTLEFDLIVLDTRNRINGERLRQQFSHVPVKGVDSFPET